MSPRRPFSPYMGPDAESPAKPEPSAPLDVPRCSVCGHRNSYCGTSCVKVPFNKAATDSKKCPDSLTPGAPLDVGARGEWWLVWGDDGEYGPFPNDLAAREAAKTCGQSVRIVRRPASPPTDVDRRLDEVRAHDATWLGSCGPDCKHGLCELLSDRRWLLSLVDELRRR